MRRRAFCLAAKFGCAFPFLLCGVLASPVAFARHRLRPRFEPGDLTLEDPGTLQIDQQVGAIRSQGPWRLVPTDFEVGLGVVNDLELSLDGAYAVEGPPAGPFTFDHSAPDLLWASAKIGLMDYADDASRSAWAFGLRLGPKFPSAPGAHGLGVEGLALLQGTVARTSLVINVGGLVDPSADADSPRARGGEGSLGVSQDLDEKGRCSLGLELSGAHFVSPDPDQLLLGGSITFALPNLLELSVTDLVGLASGSDRYGLLLGISSRWSIWRPAPH